MREIGWGAGRCLQNNAHKIMQIKEKFEVIDSDREKWNQEIYPGILCISPEILKEEKDVCIILFFDNAAVLTEVLAIIQTMEITNYIHYSSWLSRHCDAIAKAGEYRTNYYTSERNSQMLIALMKAHGIKKVVISPGTTNICFAWSLQYDGEFELYSAIDERSAAYIACGLAAECDEPVALSCTGATASRNYYPGLTEAYYRKLPILAVTSSQNSNRIGQNWPQITDRLNPPSDVAVFSVNIPMLYCYEDERLCEVKLNRALLELQRRGGGPIHINLETSYSTDYSVLKLPPTRIIRRSTLSDCFPDIGDAELAIYVGAHKVWSDLLTAQVDEFCEKYNAVVFCDHTSNYHGRYGVFISLLAEQRKIDIEELHIDTVIHIGDISGTDLAVYHFFSSLIDRVWRVHPDGELRDPFMKLEHVFEMEEITFFQIMCKNRGDSGLSCYYKWNMLYENHIRQISDSIPFSNIWIAQKTIQKLPMGSRMHLGILNSLRSWNYFKANQTLYGYSNTGGFGIDGTLSSLIGGALGDGKVLHFCILGDLSFFYDIGSLGNRHVGNNLRIMLINNGRGEEFRLCGNCGERFGTETDQYIAAAGHYGNCTSDLVKHYAQDLGFEYMVAHNKSEYLLQVDKFVRRDMSESSILFEVFTQHEDEYNALKICRNLICEELM